MLGVWAHRQAMAAKDAGADVRVIVLDRPLRRGPRRLVAELNAAANRPRTETRDGIEIEYVRFVSPPRDLSYARWHRWARRPLARALDEAQPFDVVHAHYGHLAGAAALPWTTRHAVPLVVSVHGGDVLVPALARTSAPVLHEAAVVMCNSRGILTKASELAGREDNMRVVHLGTDIPAAEDLPPKHDHTTIATLGHVIPRKRHEDVLRALPDEMRWIVIGDGPELPRLKALARDLGVEERVTFTGQLAPAEALDELARCHVMAMPSIDEAFGVAYVEALARGLPVIACEGEPGPEELTTMGAPVTLVPPKDPQAVAEAIRTVAADAALPSQARAAATAHFTWEQCGRATLEVYRSA